ncbi:MAG: hypothetical protein ACLP9D_16300 [Candidatus Bathyarchaeia archaeon]
MSLRDIAWFFSVSVLGACMFIVEAALFVPDQWFRLTDLFIPIRAALIVWTAVVLLLLLESVIQRPISPRDLLVRGASFLALAYSTYTVLVSTLGGGAYWSLVAILDLAHRLLIGLVFLVGWLYVVVSRWLERDKWVKVGEVSVDTGQLLLTDPARLYGELPQVEEVAGLKQSQRVIPTVRIEGLETPQGWTDAMASLACQILFKEGHPGAGVTVKTGAGDAQYFVYAKFGDVKGLWGIYRKIGKDRLSGIKVEFSPWRPNAEPPEVTKKKSRRTKRPKGEKH